MSYIPNSITYFKRPEQSTTWEWENGTRVDTGISVIPVFPVDPDKKNTVDTALFWVRGYKTEKPVDSITTSNEPITIQILSIEKRGKGGRAYKVIILDDKLKNFYVDLREDVLLDTALHAGIEIGGKLGGEYIWCRVGAEMKLVRVGSSLHELMINETKISKLAPLKGREIIPGGVYANKWGEEFIYFGKKWMIDFTTTPHSRYSSVNEIDISNTKFKFIKRHIWVSHRCFKEKYTHTYTISDTANKRTAYKKIKDIDIDTINDYIITCVRNAMDGSTQPLHYIDYSSLTDTKKEPILNVIDFPELKVIQNVITK